MKACNIICMDTWNMAKLNILWFVLMSFFRISGGLSVNDVAPQKEQVDVEKLQSDINNVKSYIETLQERLTEFAESKKAGTLNRKRVTEEYMLGKTNVPAHQEQYVDFNGAIAHLQLFVKRYMETIEKMILVLMRENRSMNDDIKIIQTELQTQLESHSQQINELLRTSIADLNLQMQLRTQQIENKLISRISNITQTCGIAKPQLAEKQTCRASCNSNWTKVYENGPNGETIIGNKSTLLKAATTGATIRVRTNNYITSVQNLIPIEGELCAQALFHVGQANYNSFQDDAYWWFVNMCTTGHWNMARYNIGEHVSRGDNVTRKRIQWFVRQGCDKGLALKINKDGDVLSGSVSNIVTATKRAWDVTVVGLPEGYATPVDTLEYSDDKTAVAAQALWSVSIEKSRDGSHFKFQSNAYWWFTLWSSYGHRDISRWTIGQHVSRGHTYDNTAMAWYTDSCWKLAYRHDEKGNPLGGSLVGLARAANNGHRVKLVFEKESIEATALSVYNGHVNAHLLNSVSKDNMYKFHGDMHWIWRIASTTGSIKTTRYLVGDNKYIPGSISTNKTISWFIDDRRWIHTLGVSDDGVITHGSKASLEKAVRGGACVRFKISAYRSGEESRVYQADNLKINSDGNVGAMHVRSVSVTKDVNKELKFQSNAYWFFIIADTNGKVDTSRWTVGRHDDRGHTSGKAHVQWYVST